MRELWSRWQEPDHISLWLILMFFVGASGMMGYGLWKRHQVHQVPDWPSVEARVSVSSFTYHTNLVQTDEGNQIRRETRLDFRFRYTVRTQDYTSARFYVVGYPPPETIVSNYPVGHMFSAHYDPKNPEMAVVEPGPPPYRLIVGSVVLLILTGAAVVYNRFQD